MRQNDRKMFERCCLSVVRFTPLQTNCWFVVVLVKFMVEFLIDFCKGYKDVFQLNLHLTEMTHEML